jgi:hypothetical protein
MGLSKTSIKLSCFFFVAAAQAFTIYEPDCSIPSKQVNYVRSPSSRGTLDILLKSVFAIFACTWTIHHPNVPRQFHGYPYKNKSREDESNPGPNFHSDTSWRWRLGEFLKSTAIMVLTVLAPEVIIAVAYNDLLAAKADHELLLMRANKDNISWSWIHTYYANMGGFVIRKKDDNNDARGGDTYNMHHLSGRDILILRDQGCIKELPNIPKRDLKDRAKSDSLVKAISVIQIVWSTARIFDRAITRLPVCALELTVVAFALCAIVIYWLYWDKPKRIGVVTTIDRSVDYEVIENVLVDAKSKGVHIKIIETKKTGITKTISDASTGTGGDTVNEQPTPIKFLKPYSTKHIFSLKSTQASLKKAQASFKNPRANHQKRTTVDADGAPMRIDSIRSGKEFDNGTFGALLGGILLFGSIHLGGWHIEFPSPTHQMLWRVATFYSVGCIFIALSAVLLRKIGESGTYEKTLFGKLSKICGRVLHITGLFLYVMARLVILFEMFWTLLFLPPKTFVSSV